MTTVAYRSGMIAADTGMTVGGLVVGSMTKIARRADGTLAGICGTAGFSHAFLKWFIGGEDPTDCPQPQNDPDSEGMERAIIIRPDRPNVVEVLEPDHSWFDCHCPYYAMGSGREIALGCMWKGGDPQEAVSAALTHDTATFGNVEHLRF